MGRRIRIESGDASLPAGVIVITHRERGEFIFVPTFLLVLQPVAPVLFAIYISCYAPMTNASVVLANLQSRCLPMQEKKSRTPLTVCARASNYLDQENAGVAIYEFLNSLERSALPIS